MSRWALTLALGCSAAPSLGWAQHAPSLAPHDVAAHSVVAHGVVGTPTAVNAPTSPPDSASVTVPVTAPAGDSSSHTTRDPFAPRSDSALVDDSTVLGVAVALEVHLAKVGSMTVKGYDTGTHLYVPLSPMCQLVDLRCSGDVVQHRLQLGTTVVASDDSLLTSVRGTLYVSLDWWTQELHVRATIDRDDARVDLHGGASLPAVRQALRAAARERLVDDASDASFDAPDEITAGQLDLRSKRPAWGGLTMDYSMTNQRSGASDVTTYMLSGATAVAGGSLIAEAIGSPGRVYGEYIWRKVWSESSPVTQLRFGQSFSSGLTSIPLRGVYVSNVPYSEPVQLAVYPVTGILPPQWSVDVLRDGTLVGFDTVDAAGRYDVAVPMDYGENPYTVVQYGPGGDSSSVVRVIHPLGDMVPPGKLYYAASAGACVSTTCKGLANADLRYGLTPRLTVRGGVTTYTLAGGMTLSRGYVGLSALPGEPLGITLEAMPGVHERASAAFEPNNALMLQANYVQYASTAAGAAESGVAGLRQSGVMGRLSPWVRGPALDMYAFRTGGIPGGAVTSGQIDVTLPLNGMTLTPYMRRSIASGISSDFRGVQMTMTSLPLGFGRLAPAAWIRGTFEWHTNGQSSYQEMVLSRPALGFLQIEAGARRTEGVAGVRAVLGATFNLSAIRTVSSATSSAGGTPGQFLQMTTGSLRWDPQFGRIVPSADLSIDRAGVSGIVYLDANGNHQLDPGEERLAGVTVRINGSTSVTNSRGEYEVWGLAAMTSVAIAVDTATLPQPWYAPSYTRLVVRPTLDRAAPADIPILIGGIIEGAVVCHDAACSSFPALVIVNRTTGRQLRIDTFDDGAFYRMGIAPGSYLATVDSSEAHALNVTTTPVPFTVTPGETTPRFTVVLRKSARRMSDASTEGDD